MAGFSFHGIYVKYDKPALSFDRQAQRLIDRGLIVRDKTALIQKLKAVNYYRLSAYWYLFKQNSPAGERFAPNTTFDMIWRRYTLDRELRLLVMDAAELIEVAILRTRMVEQFTLRYGPFGYIDPRNFRVEFDPHAHAQLVSEIDEAVNRSKEEFVQRFRRKYTHETHLPLWMTTEVMTFGQLFTMFRYLNFNEQQTLAKPFRIFPPVMISWLHTINFVRNVCAHHARLWNRELPISPLIPYQRHNPEWYSSGVQFSNKRVFVVLTLLQFLLAQIDPNNHWQDRVGNLLKAYPDIPISLMGFPANWKQLPIWQ